MIVQDIVEVLESFAPLSLQEKYDNSGLCLGSQEQNVESILIALDITEAVVDEAIKKGTQLIIAHHPLIFNSIKKINGNNDLERCVMKAIRHNIAIYCGHTNFDNAENGVSFQLASVLGLHNTKVLKPMDQTLIKLVCFVPETHANALRQAIFDAGAGRIGNYDSCSFNISGNGTFRADDNCKPYVGEIGKLHTEAEIRIETIVPQHLLKKVLQAMHQNHPYEEVAYDLYPLNTVSPLIGSGIIGELNQSLSEQEFLELIKDKLNTQGIRHSTFIGRKIQKVAVCGGSGSFLVADAIRAKADVLVTGDLKYHQFLEAEGEIMLVDAGHAETEQFIKKLFYALITKKFPNFAIHFSEVNTNPINYF